MSEYILNVPDYVPPFDPAVRAASLGEEVVRCRDCKHFASDELGDCRTLLDFEDVKSMGDGFCAWGERRDA